MSSPSEGSNPSLEQTSTQMDMGDDLLETKTNLEEVERQIREAQSPNLSTSPAELLENARILMGEGFLDEAKRILRALILRDAENIGARKRLEEIHERELKQLLGGASASPSERLTPSEKAKREQSADEQRQFDLIDPDRIMRDLDKDLDLGIFFDDREGSGTHEFDFFGDQAAMETFCSNLEKASIDSTSRERLDMGIGFLEMGLYDVALKQFQAASRSEELQLTAASLSAFALIESGRAFEATLELEPLLGDSDMPPSERIHFLYLMGLAHERLGRQDQARHRYRQAYEIDPDYRDVAERLRAKSGIPGGQ